MSIYTEVTGRAFKEMIGHKNVYKILTKNLIHKRHRYRIGLNRDTASFNPSGSGADGGFYFAKLEEVFRFTSTGTNIGIINLYDDSRVYIDNGRYKTDILEMVDITSLKEFINSSDEMKMLAVSQNGFALEYIDSQTYQLCKTAVTENGFAIMYVQAKYLTEELKLLAVRENGLAIEFIDRPSEEVYDEAVKQNPAAKELIHWVSQKHSPVL